MYSEILSLNAVEQRNWSMPASWRQETRPGPGKYLNQSGNSGLLKGRCPSIRLSKAEERHVQIWRSHPTPKLSKSYSLKFH